MVSSFEQAGAQLAGVAARQTDLQRAVAAGWLASRNDEPTTIAGMPRS
ncbi:MAG: hypothetical protein ACRDTD_24290 [Pseudonocardiaceae bacterium]